MHNCTRLKSYRIRQGGSRARALGQVAHTHVTRFIGLTGTPAPNGIKDLWGQMWFLDQGERLGRTFSAFEQRWFRKGYDGYSLVPYDHTQEEVQDKLKDICLTVTGLPVDEALVNPVYVTLPTHVRRAYDEMETELFAELESGAEVEAANAAVKTQKLLQIANGAMYVDDEHNWEEVHTAKMDALESIIEEAGGAPVLVAYHFKHDLERLRRRFKHARVLDADPQTIHDWNAGHISLLLAHPACLTPWTEVLTENRGWVRIIDVQAQDRVHDGVEFVEHKGCSFSGVKPVISVFGIGMTPDHKLLVGGAWMEAKRVRDIGKTAREARYTYEGDDPCLRALFEMPASANGARAERAPRKPAAAETLPTLPAGRVSHDDRDPLLADMEGYGQSRYGYGEQRLRKVRRRWSWSVRGLVAFRKLLSRYVGGLRGALDDRPARQFTGVLPRQLPLGDERGAAVEQRKQPRDPLSGARHAFSRVLQSGGREPGRDISAFELWHDGGRGGRGLPEIPVQKRQSTSPVYDLVDCGPRNRFLIRNVDGDVFISHNSAGHGLNLADGGNILAMFGVNWNLEEYMQIIERIGPMRQKQAGYDRPCLVYPILASDTVDEVVMDRLASKRSVQDVLLAAMQRRKK